MSECPLLPYGSNVVVCRDETADVTKGGILLPDGSKELPRRGTVMAVGFGTQLESGEVAPVRLEVGAVIYFGQFAGTEFEIDGEKWIVLPEQAVLAAHMQETTE